MTSLAAPLAALFASRTADTAPARQPPRPASGPVLMGDIHGQLGGTPLLLLLWRRWEEDDDARL